jgi:hypothetical protein
MGFTASPVSLSNLTSAQVLAVTAWLSIVRLEGLRAEQDPPGDFANDGRDWRLTESRLIAGSGHRHAERFCPPTRRRGIALDAHSERYGAAPARA